MSALIGWKSGAFVLPHPIGADTFASDTYVTCIRNEWGWEETSSGPNEQIREAFGYSMCVSGLRMQTLVFRYLYSKEAGRQVNNVLLKRLSSLCFLLSR